MSNLKFPLLNLEIKIAFTGDIMLSRNVAKRIGSSPIISASVAEFLESHDFVVGNLECPIAHQSKKNNENAFKADPMSLKEVSCFNLFSLANNHIFDCGKEGAQETIEFLNRENILNSGLLFNDKTSFNTSVILKNKKISFFSCAVDECIKNENKNFPKIICAQSNDLQQHIQICSRNSDCTIVLLHGGNELVPYPEPEFRNLCLSFLNSGADVVVTHHPHILGGVEEHKNKFIFYSLGDFIFDGESNKRRRSAILSFTISDSVNKWRLIPVYIDQTITIKRATGKLERKIISKYKSVSKLIIQKNYFKIYKLLYTVELISFQLDRLYYILKNRGFNASLRFVFSKIYLMPYYLKKILTN